MENEKKGRRRGREKDGEKRIGKEMRWRKK